METVVGLALIVVATWLAIAIARAAQRGIKNFDEQGHEMFGAEKLEGIDG